MPTGLLRRLLTDAPLAGLALFALVAVSAGIASQLANTPEPAEGSNVLARLFGICVVNATLLTWMILRSAASGGRLVGLVVALYFGVVAFMTQNETLYFNRALEVPASVVIAHLGASFAAALAFAVGPGLWIARHRQGPPDVRTGVTARGRAWKIAVLACGFYPLLYFAFGYWVLWQNDAARLLYQGSRELLPIGEHLRGVLRDDPWLYPWQCLRGGAWVGLACLVMRDSRARWLETGLLVGLLFGFLMSLQLFLPNPFMPPEVRFWHFVETTLSNFLLGVGSVWLLRATPRLR